MTQLPDICLQSASIQTKSKQRVAGFGEVYTSSREVNAMLDLVKQETERIESRFLEPACGNGRRQYD
jgi:type I restriction-modification system DNA methylase subunit